MSVAAIILAAGASARLGSPKQLVRLEGETLVRRAARIALEAGCTPAVVVTGEDHELVERELSDLPVVLVRNEAWSEGIASSIRTGVAAARESDAVLIMTCDQPLVHPVALQRLMQLRETTNKPIVASAYADTVGVPALFARPIFAELLELSGDEGAKRVILSNRERVAEFSFHDARIDIDTTEDLKWIGRSAPSGRADERGEEM